MRRFDLIIVLCGILALVGVVGFNLFGQSLQTTLFFPPLSFLTQKKTADFASTHGTGITLTPTPTAEYVPALTLTNIPTPQKLTIKRLNLQAIIEQVGETEKGNMEVPANAANVGWYKEGTVPSEKGNAVLTGHYDTPSGRPAVFYKLYDLAIGDAIDVEFSNGSLKSFIVTGKDFIHLDVFPTQYVFNEKYGYNLNLITCGGVWDPKEKNYNTSCNFKYISYVF